MKQTVRALMAVSGLPGLEVRMLLEHVLQVPRAWLIAHDDEPLAPQAVARYLDLAQQRRNGRPMAYLLGRREFMGHEFTITPSVLIPRPDTELLVEVAIEALGGSEAPRVLDLGTGSGSIAVSVALACPGAQVVATDASAAALEVAAGNAQRLGARVEFCSGDWYQALAAGRVFDLIVSNPPYIARHDAHLAQGDLRYEPQAALTDGADGLRALAAIAAGAPERLAPGGQLWMEHGWDQAQAVRGLLAAAGFGRIASRKDLAGIERVSGGSIIN
ncbi:peptide chain release factor N(5)-glutamine methyltransferase [Candidimonas nitroreducens]|uniref:Release factor glutamine methyltransferase n=1 Tax=Candidimonas nitroreducens TaxID=683354 RepID=A0A225MCZ1_9BURK|nr:peptide chain release factor N(5)-glutamine methyltransferase [Candidimonas nitroreducens]OWT59164.1 protein-(glutamine-N5) methyltransferase, release factor-specific [Candidimonas nitroreducens]